MSFNIKNADCLDLMADMPDNYFDLAVVDPPYFKGPEARKFYGQKKSEIGVARVNYQTIKSWEVPCDRYFEELKRVSKQQIVWGCNYYPQYLGAGRIVWDKVNQASSFSDCEIAYTSKHDSVRLFRYMWNGMLQGKSITEGHVMQGDKSKNEKRIHQTQKPVALYEWLFQNYAKEGDKILDTHLGSASSYIAASKMGMGEFLGIEKDLEIFKLAVKRTSQFEKQLSII